MNRIVDVGAVRSILVIATDVLLNDRFKQLPSHNPLRPNSTGDFKRTVYNDLDNVDEDDDIEIGAFPIPAKLSQNKNARSKDWEISRLRNLLKTTQLRLNLVNARKGVMRTRLDAAPTRNPNILKRIGGGVSVKKRGKGKALNIRNQKFAMGFLNSDSNKKIDLSGISPMLKDGKGKQLNFFGKPKSKDDLDKELESYMSKAKTKQKSTLDKELDDYMEARARAMANKSCLKPPLKESESSSMVGSPVLVIDESSPAPPQTEPIQEKEMDSFITDADEEMQELTE